MISIETHTYIKTLAVNRTFVSYRTFFLYFAGWNFLLKKWWAEQVIKSIKREQKVELQQNELNCNYKTEEIKLLETENSSDSQLIYGSDVGGNSILIKLTRRRLRNAEVWMTVRLANGAVYTLPSKNQPHRTHSVN